MKFCIDCKFGGIKEDGTIPAGMMCFHPLAKTVGFNLVTGQAMDRRRTAWHMRMETDFTTDNPDEANDCGREGRLFVKNDTGAADPITQVEDVFVAEVEAAPLGVARAVR